MEFIGDLFYRGVEYIANSIYRSRNRALVPVRERKTWLLAPIGEQKPYRNISRRGLVPIGRWNM
jgi:hypothetical protein